MPHAHIWLLLSTGRQRFVAEEYLASVFGIYKKFHLKIKAVGSLETSVNARQTTWRHISSGCSVHSHLLTKAVLKMTYSLTQTAV
jgi:hypothetical protein